MSDSNSSNKTPKPNTPPVPSPPLPKIPPTGDAKKQTPAPVPSPPLPPIAPKSSPPTPPPGGFKLSGDQAQPQAPVAAPQQLTPEEEALLPQEETAPQPVKRQRVARPLEGQTTQQPTSPPSPPSPKHTPAVPRPASIQSMHVEEEPIEPIHHGEPGWRDWIERAEPVLMWLFRVSAFFCAMSLGFLLYAIFVTKVGQPGTPASAVATLNTTVTIFHWSAIALAICSVILAIDSIELGIGLALGGILLHFGAPWLFSNYVGENAASLAIAQSLRTTGLWLAAIGVFKAAIDLMQWIIALPERMKQRADVGVGSKAEAAQQRIARDANVLSPCWKLPFCRETIRKQCPAFLARKTCWRFGRGCYCDEEMISRIIRGESLEAIKAPTRLSKTGKAPCGRCHIYLEHQGHKFKALSPLTLPITIVIMYVVWPYWEKLFAAFSTSSVWSILSFDTRKLTPDAIATETKVDTGGGLPPEQVMHVATILFGVLIGFFVLVYVAKFIEWFVYKAKL